MAEQTEFEGGFERTYECTGTTVRVAGDSGFISVEHSELDKPVKIHLQKVEEMAEEAREEETAFFL